MMETVLVVAHRRKDLTFTELVGRPGRVRLVVVAGAAGGRWSEKKKKKRFSTCSRDPKPDQSTCCCPRPNTRSCFRGVLCGLRCCASWPNHISSVITMHCAKVVSRPRHRRWISKRVIMVWLSFTHSYGAEAGIPICLGLLRREAKQVRSPLGSTVATGGGGLGSAPVPFGTRCVSKPSVVWVSVCAWPSFANFLNGRARASADAKLHVESSMQGMRTRRSSSTHWWRKTSVIPAGSGMTSMTDVARCQGFWNW